MPAAGIEVVIVCGKSRLLETAGLVVAQHSQRHACFHAEPAHNANHFQDAVELLSILRPAPGGAHAKTRRPELFRLCRSFSDRLDTQE